MKAVKNKISDSIDLKKKEIFFLTSEIQGEQPSTFRQGRWCKVFLEKGAIIHIYNLRGAFKLSYVKCSNIEEFQKFRSGEKEKISSRPSVREGLLVNFLRIIKHFFLVDLYLPNVFILFSRFNKLLNSLNEPVIIMASSPPFSLALVAALLKRRYNRKITCVIDLRDAWGLHTSLGGIIWLKRLIEKTLIESADYVTTVSIGLKKEYESTYNINVGVMYNIATHYFNNQKTNIKIDWHSLNPNINERRIKIVYTGSTPKKFYDKQAIVGAISNLRRNRPEIMDCVQFIFIGACAEIFNEAMRMGISKTDMIFVEHVPHDLARRIQSNADILLFLGYIGVGNQGVVGTKIFEYMLLGKPILPISLHNNSDVDMLLSDYCKTSLNLHSVDQITEALVRIVDEGYDFLPKLVNSTDVQKLVHSYYDFASILLKD